VSQAQLHHLTVQGKNRQKVKLACELFSHSTAAAILATTNDKESVEFFGTVNSYFDVMNSRVPFVSGNILKSAYGNALEEQETNMETLCQDMRVDGKRNLLPFQRGILMNMSSLRGLLYSYMRSLGMRYIMTSHINQDCLENLFSQVRGLGRFYDNPLPTEFKARLKIVLLTSKLPQLSQCSRVQHEGGEDGFLSAQLLQPSLGNYEQEILDTSNICEAIRSTEASVKVPTAALVQNVANTMSGQNGRKYVAGYIAFKLKQSNLSAGLVTMPNIDGEWLSVLSRGRLTSSSFSAIHGKSLSSQTGIVGMLRDHIRSAFPEVDDDVIKFYSRIRIFIRMRELNARMIQLKQQRWVANRILFPNGTLYLSLQ